MHWKAALLLGIAMGAFVGPMVTGSTSDQDSRADATKAPPARIHVSMEDLPWMTTSRYPEWFRKTYRYRELVGWISNWQDAQAAAWKGIANAEIRMGVLHLDRGSVYPFHFHPAPELYYVLRGIAEWTVGAETFGATPGTAIHTSPNVHHRMRNTGDTTLELLYVWWAPGGDSQVLNVPSSMGEGWNLPKDGIFD